MRDSSFFLLYSTSAIIDASLSAVNTDLQYSRCLWDGTEGLIQYIRRQQPCCMQWSCIARTSIACKAGAKSPGRERGRKGRKGKGDPLPQSPSSFSIFSVPVPSPFNTRHTGLNPTTPLYRGTHYLLAGADAIEFHSVISRSGIKYTCIMADISIKWILATKYFLLQIQMIMIVVRIKNNNSALLQRIITNPYLFFIYLFILFVSFAGRAKSSNKISRLLIDNNYSPKWRRLVLARYTEPRSGKVHIHHLLRTLRWITVLVYTKIVR